MHLAAIAALPHATVTAVLDRDLRAAKSVALPLGAVVGSSLEELPRSVVEQAVVTIATPGRTHHDLVLQATRRGATVIVEKPVVLSTGQLDSIAEASSTATIDVFHNYRLRPATLALWRFLVKHDVGPVRRASLTFHSPRIETERARWLRDETRSRGLVVELGVHFLDLAFLVAGRLQTIHDLDVRLDPRGGGLVQAAGRVETSTGARIVFDLDIRGVAQRTQLVLAFERATCVLDFFPDGFRVLPPRAHPIDDIAMTAGRLGSALIQRLRPQHDGVPRRALPHAAIYRAHLLSRESGTPSPFAVDAVEPSMRSILELADALYDPVAAT
jgi:predicted dehydrogenase